MDLKKRLTDISGRTSNETASKAVGSIFVRCEQVGIVSVQEQSGRTVIKTNEFHFTARSMTEEQLCAYQVEEAIKKTES
ncbi:hypothetical protein IMY05_C4833000100 [Salix suchowensis]|nr:hypothetical protein IMY05_C4833000100 [Salix suchowensis]